MLEVGLKGTVSDQTKLAQYLAINYDQDDIIDIISFKKSLSFFAEDGKDAEASRAERFDKYMKDYALEWGTYKDNTYVSTSDTHECAIAYRGNLNSLVSAKPIPCDLMIESDFHVISSFSDPLYGLKFWEIYKLDDDFALATFHHPSKETVPTTPEEEQCVILGRINTIIGMISYRCTHVLATHGEEWFTTPVEKECMKTYATPRLMLLHAIPGRSGCKCNKLIKRFVWKLSDSISDFK